MAKIQTLQLFIKLAESGSFHSAAKQLNIPTTTASRQIKALEQTLGISLINRNTRHLNLTEAGKVFRQRAINIITEYNNAVNELKDLKSTMQGKLRIGLPNILEHLNISHFVAEFIQKHPDTQIELHFSNDFSNILVDDLDLVFRVTTKKIDENIIARKLHTMPMALIASPAYLAKHPLHRLDEIPRHQLIMDINMKPPNRWIFSDNKVITFEKSVLTVNSGVSSVEAVVAGLGITYTPLLFAQKAVTEKKVELLFTDCITQQFTVYAVYPSNRYIPQLCKSFVEAFFKHIKQY